MADCVTEEFPISREFMAQLLDVTDQVLFQVVCDFVDEHERLPLFAWTWTTLAPIFADTRTITLGATCGDVIVSVQGRVNSRAIDCRSVTLDQFNAYRAQRALEIN